MTDVLESARAEAVVLTGGGAAPAGQMMQVLQGPLHCGTSMELAYVPLSAQLPWNPDEPLNAEWTCACGFRMTAATTEETEPLNAVRLASARLETVQWELDHAQDMLARAIRKATAFGASPAALRDAANMDDTELQALL